MKYTRINELIECMKPHQKLRAMKIIAQADPYFIEEVKEYVERGPHILSWKEDPLTFMTIILEACCDEYGTSIESIMNGSRLTNEIESKRTWIFLCDGVMPKNYAVIANFIDMDASSIVYHIRKTNGFLLNDKDYRYRVEKIIQAIKIEGLEEVVEFYQRKMEEINRLQRKR